MYNRFEFLTSRIAVAAMAALLSAAGASADGILFENLAAEPLVLDLRVDPGQAESMHTFEVTVLEEIDQDTLYSFIQECQFRAGLSSDSDWFLATVTDDDVLKCRFRGSSRTMEMDLEAITQYSRADGLPSDKYFWEQIIARFDPELGYEHRVRFIHGSWSWSGWTTDRIVRSIPAPEAGQESVLEFEVETRQVGTLNVIPMSGYIKIKKLDSGG